MVQALRGAVKSAVLSGGGWHSYAVSVEGSLRVGLQNATGAGSQVDVIAVKRLGCAGLPAIAFVLAARLGGDKTHS